VYADDVIILSGSANTIKKNTEALLIGSKVAGREVNAHKISTWSCTEIIT
jgi:hypothetical protein